MNTNCTITVSQINGNEVGSIYIDHTGCKFTSKVRPEFNRILSFDTMIATLEPAAGGEGGTQIIGALNAALSRNICVLEDAYIAMPAIFDATNCPLLTHAAATRSHMFYIHDRECSMACFGPALSTNSIAIDVGGPVGKIATFIPIMPEVFEKHVAPNRLKLMRVPASGVHPELEAAASDPIPYCILFVFRPSGVTLYQHFMPTTQK